MLVTALLLATATVQQAENPAVLAAHHTVEAFADTGAARRGGFVPFAAFGVQDLSPFQGAHWLHLGHLEANSVEFGRPTFIMYIPVRGAMKPVGVAYSIQIPADEAAPSSLGTDHAEWHEHLWCRQIPGESIALANGPEDCADRGGVGAPEKTTMVHVWTAEVPGGRYAAQNSALPYLAVGLTPPSALWHGGADARRARKLAISIAETYGALMPYARRMEMFPASQEPLAALAEHRLALSTQVDRLIEAAAADDAEAYEETVVVVLETWDAMMKLYRQMAATPQLEAQLDKEYESMLMGGHGH